MDRFLQGCQEADAQNLEIRLRAVAWTGIEALSLDQHEYRAV
jgi:hypothetical protein